MFKIISILILLQIGFALSQSPPTVKLPLGALRGKWETSRNGVQYEAYLGIRYGQVEKRFGISEPIKSQWEETKDANEYGSHCTQPSVAEPNVVVGTEDCLFLNVFTPKAITNRKRPVLFYIHGGGFTFGTGAPFGGNYLMDEDIVLVTVNYRLGILGFLNMMNGEAAGNMGLKDQLLALKWVNSNIEYFGGDKSKVTISGASAGGAASIYLILSPAARGLFHNAIPFSGSPLNPWAFATSSETNAEKVGKHLNCENGPHFVQCLRSKTVEELLAAQSSLVEWFMDPMDPFPPTLEIQDENSNPSPFMVESPADVLQSKTFNPVPVLITMNRDEGVVLYGAVVIRTESKRKELDEDFAKVGPLTFCYKTNKNLASSRETLNWASSQIRSFYFGDKEINFSTADNLTNLYTDTLFGLGINTAALELGKVSKVYAGLFTHVSKDFSTSQVFGIEEILGIGHGDEASYIFNPAIGNAPLPIIAQITSEVDIRFSRKITKLVAHFAEFSVPDKDTFKDWVKVSSKEIKENALNWFPLEDSSSSKVLLSPFSGRISFWDELNNNGNSRNKDEL